MYHAKEMRSGIEVYDVERDPSNPRRVGMLAELRNAIPNDELVLFYQPKVDLAAGRVVGAEALIRWFHPERGMVPPDDFVPLAERSGLIAPLTDWVATTTIRQIRAWQDLGLDLTVAMNVSIRNLYDRRFPERLHALLEQFGVSASRLKLEITECTLMTDPKRAAPSLQELDEMGISMSLDDFGTGYSSLTYLKRLPVRELKIDKSFVMNMMQDSQDVAIVRTTIDLGRSLGMRVVRRRGGGPGGHGAAHLLRLPRRPGVPHQQAAAGRAVPALRRHAPRRPRPAHPRDVGTGRLRPRRARAGRARRPRRRRRSPSGHPDPSAGETAAMPPSDRPDAQPDATSDGSKRASPPSRRGSTASRTRTRCTGS